MYGAKFGATRLLSSLQGLFTSTPLQLDKCSRTAAHMLKHSLNEPHRIQCKGFCDVMKTCLFADLRNARWGGMTLLPCLPLASASSPGKVISYYPAHPDKKDKARCTALFLCRSSIISIPIIILPTCALHGFVHCKSCLLHSSSSSASSGSLKISQLSKAEEGPMGHLRSKHQVARHILLQTRSRV